MTNFFREEMLYHEIIDIMRSPEVLKIITGSFVQRLEKLEKNDWFLLFKMLHFHIYI